MERIVGIDLGTTNSVVAYYEQGQVQVIQNSEGAKTTPSVVLLKSSDEIIVGELAKRQLVTNPTQTIRSIKRFMGGRYSELTPDRLKGISYNLAQGPEDSILVDVGWGQFTPEQISSFILQKMRATAEEYFGETVNKAVITVPAYFNDNQRAATKRAGELAGLEVLRIINEPTAAALAYGVDRRISQKLAIFDFGGGTFDVSVLDVDMDVFEVRSTNGNTFLGGDNIDEVLMSDFLRRFNNDSGVDITGDLQAYQRLREAVEKVKCELSTTSETVLSLPFVAVGPGGPVHMNYPLKRAHLEELIKPVLPGLSKCCESALGDAGLTYKDIHSVLLVGGSTRIPAVQDLVRKFFGKEPNRTLNPDEAVAIGAAVQASILSGSLREVLLLDVTPLSLGIELSGGLFSVLIPRNSSIPTAVHKTFTTVRDNQGTVKIHVLQGERRMAVENHTLGYFQLTGISPAPKEIPEINVCFQIDANGILEVSATDVTSGSSSSVTIESVGHLTEELIKTTVIAAEEHAPDDRAFVRMRQLRTRTDELASKFQLLLTDEERPLDPMVAASIKEALFKFDVAYSSGNLDEVENAFEHVDRIADDLAAHLLLKQYGTPGIDE